MSLHAWSIDEVRALPVVMPLTTAGQVLGRGRTAIYQDHRGGRLPFEVLTLGSRLLVRRGDLLTLLGIVDGVAVTSSEVRHALQ